MGLFTLELPDNLIPEYKKDLKWHTEHVYKLMDHITSNHYIEKVKKMVEVYQAFMGEKPPAAALTEKQYGYDLGVKYDVYPLIESTIEQLLGDYLSKEIKRKLYSINREAVNSKLDTKLDYITEEIFREYNQKAQKDMQAQGVDVPLETENQHIELPEDVEEFFEKTFKTVAEEQGDDFITLFLDVNGNKRKIKQLLIHYLVAGTTAGFISEEGDHLGLDVLSFDEAFYDKDPSKDVQDKMSVFAKYKYYTQSEIYAKFPLDPEQKKKVKAAFSKMEAGNLLQADYAFSENLGTFVNSTSGTTYKGWSDESNGSFRLRVVEMTWISPKELRAKKYKDKQTGRERTKLLSDRYKERSKDNIERVAVDTKRHITMLGPEIVLSWGLIEDRLTSEDDKTTANIEAVALIDHNFLKTNELRSVGAKLIGLQNWASDLLFELKLLTKNNKGKVMVYDTAQTPKQFLKDGPQKALPRVMHHIKKDQLVFINSEDKNIRHSFNQFTSIDLSNRGAIKDLMEGLMLAEDLAEKYVGLVKERKEGGEKYQTATGVNRAILSSNARTDVVFEPFDALIEALLYKFLAKAKSFYKKGQVISYAFGDMQTKFLSVSDKFSRTDLGIYIGNSAKNSRDKQVIDGAAGQLLSNAQDVEMVRDLIDVLENDSATEAKSIFDRAAARVQERREQDQKIAAEEQDKNLKAEAERQEKADQLVRDGYDKDITVAKIYADNKAYTENQRNETSKLETAAKLNVDLIKDQNSSANKSAESKPSSSAKKPTDNKPKK